jgi:cell division protein FtsW
MLNIGGITRVIPLTGVPLPFLSFGSNALAAVMTAVGVLLSVSRYGQGPERARAAADPRRLIVRRRQ